MMRRMSVTRRRRAPKGWVPPGPPSLADARICASTDEDLSYLTGDWRIFQKKRGHRWSLDDLATADFAAEGASSRGLVPATIVDLGCGIGSVLLMMAWHFPEARCLGVEAQAVSADLADKSIAFNGLGARVRVERGDLRSTALPVADLVTGTPPYFPEGTGSIPNRPQAPGALFELRGGPEAYVHTASRILGPHGLFAFCTSVKQEARVRAVLPEHGLSIRRFQYVVPREGKAPLVCLWLTSREAAVEERLAPLVVRDLKGQWTAPFQALRLRMGLPPREG